MIWTHLWKTRKPRRAGFTILEILLVVAIIAIMAAAAVPHLAGKSREAKIVRAKQDILGSIGTALDLYEQTVGSHPTTEQGLQALVAEPGGVQGWDGPYLKQVSVPRDPWGNEYVYTFPSPDYPAFYELVSKGPDGQLGTEDDISNLETDDQP